MPADDDTRTWYGWAEISPAGPIVAGRLGRWQITYYVGRYGVAAGGSLKLLFHAASDWPPLQGRDPYEESFLTVSTPAHAQLAWRYDPRGHAHPWPKAVIVEVAQRGLAEGDTVVFDLGNPEGGSPGVRAQTFAERNHELRVVVDPFASGQYVAVPSPTVDIVAGPAERLVLTVPSEVAAGEPFALTLRAEDRWGNLARGHTGRIALEGIPALTAIELAPADGGVRRIGGLRLERPGTYRVRGRDLTAGLEGESNPLQVRAAAAGTLLPLWGDLGGESGEACGTGTAAECLAFARDVAALDFCALQPRACRVPSADWPAVQEAVRAHDEPGRFAALLGFTWAGNTCGGGSRLVLFGGDAAGLHRCCPAEPGGGPAQPACYPLSALYEALAGQQALLIAGGCGPAPSLECYDESLEGLVEVWSGWGASPWLLDEALARGYRVGVIASSGDLQGRPGASWPGAGERVVRGGLTCVYAEERTREAIWQALRARRCYATSGPRILLSVHADGHAMGEVYPASAPPDLAVHVAGTAEIEVVEVHRGSEVAYRWPETDPGRPGWLRVAWGGALARDWPRAVPWDGTLRVHGARIKKATPYGFDSPARGIVLQSEDALSWRPLTAGNENGLLLELEAGPDARLDLYAPMIDLKIPLDSLPFRKDLGGDGLHVRVEPCPAGSGHREVALAWRDAALRPGTTPYYVTVRQVDGAQAWSSPIYVVGVPAPTQA